VCDGELDVLLVHIAAFKTRYLNASKAAVRAGHMLEEPESCGLDG
jgi:hypothetical protein